MGPRRAGRLAHLAGEPSPTGERTVRRGSSPSPAPESLAAVLATRGRRRVRDGRPQDRRRRRPAARRRGPPAAGLSPRPARRRAALEASSRSGKPPVPGTTASSADAQLRRAWGRTVRLPRRSSHLRTC